MSGERELVLCTTFPQFPGDPRGEFVLRHWTREAERGASVRVIAPRTAWSAELPGACEVVRVRYAPRRLSSVTGRFGILENIRERRWRSLLVGPLWLALRASLREELRSNRPDRVTAHMLLPAGWIVATECARRGVPFTLFGHGTDVDVLLALPRPLRSRFAGLCGSAQRIFLPSRDKLERFVDGLFGGVRPANLRVATFGDCVPPAPELAGPPPARTSILFMGRLIRQKGADDLLSAAALLEGRPQVDVAGDGPELPKLEALARRLGVEARFHGFVSGGVKAALFQRAAVLCVPSRELPSGLSEGAPLVIVEARRHGVPVVATQVGGIPELCTDDELVPQGDVAALARALEVALRKPWASSPGH